MDFETEELQFFTIPEISKESISIPKQSPKTFKLITLALIFPLSLATLAHSLFTHPLLSQIQDHPSMDPCFSFSILLSYLFICLLSFINCCCCFHCCFSLHFKACFFCVWVNHLCLCPSHPRMLFSCKHIGTLHAENNNYIGLTSISI